MDEIIKTNEFKKRLAQLFGLSGLSGFPRKERDRHILLKAATLTLDRTHEYSETEINLELQCWLQAVGSTTGLDHVELRRRLVDHEYLGRAKDGSRYWVAVSSRRQMQFDDAIEQVEVVSLIEQEQQRIRERKKRYLLMNQA